MPANDTDVVSPRTAAHQLADVLLGDQGPLEAFVRERRAAKSSWRHIARDLYDATDGQVDLTAEVIRRWFPAPAEAAR